MLNPRRRKAGELSDITFPDDSLIQSRGIEGVHPERSNASTSQESHQGEALDPVHAQSTYRVPHFARDGHTQAGMDERGLVESNHAISYVNNIKVRDHSFQFRKSPNPSARTASRHSPASTTSSWRSYRRISVIPCQPRIFTHR